jgi:hypothetical protein
MKQFAATAANGNFTQKSFAATAASRNFPESRLRRLPQAGIFPKVICGGCRKQEFSQKSLKINNYYNEKIYPLFPTCPLQHPA